MFPENEIDFPLSLKVVEFSILNSRLTEIAFEAVFVPPLRVRLSYVSLTTF